MANGNPRLNHPAHEKAALGLWLALQACQEYLDEHWDKVGNRHDCDDRLRCETCRTEDTYHEMEGISYTVEMFASLLDGNLIHRPGGFLYSLWDLVRRRDGGPDTADFVRALQAVQAAEQAADAEAQAEPDCVFAGELAPA